MSIRCFAIAMLVMLSGCQSHEPKSFINENELTKSRKSFDLDYQRRLNLLVSSSKSQEENVISLMDSSLKECGQKLASSGSDGSKCASDSLVVVYGYMERSFRLRDEVPKGNYESFTDAVEKWVLYMSKLQTDPTYTGIINLQLLAYYSVLAASKMMPVSD